VGKLYWKLYAHSGGLGYLSLDRETMTLSGGESQRIKMVRHLSSSLTEMIYVFDEPTIGLHTRVKSTCEVCGGKRFTQEVLHHKLRGRSISDVYEMTAGEALEFFMEKKLQTVLQALNDVGLGYLKLGQPLSTLSGGECQHIKLATELHKDGSIYVMDEPTTGLHMSDVRHLLDIIERLVGKSNSVIPATATPITVGGARSRSEYAAAGSKARLPRVGGPVPPDNVAQLGAKLQARAQDETRRIIEAWERLRKQSSCLRPAPWWHSR